MNLVHSLRTINSQSLPWLIRFGRNLNTRLECLMTYADVQLWTTDIIINCPSAYVIYTTYVKPCQRGNINGWTCKMKRYPKKCWLRQILSCVRSFDLLALLGGPALVVTFLCPPNWPNWEKRTAVFTYSVSQLGSWLLIHVSQANLT